jgi:ribosomal-protein-alanine acetyltransferase
VSTLSFANATVELMQEHDIPHVLDVERQSNPHPWSEQNFRDAFRSGYLCLIAREHGSVSGFAIVRTLVDDAELLLIAVAPNARRGGCGSMLLAEIAMRMKTQGKLTLHIEVRSSNQGAISFYLARGFVRTGLRKAYYPSGVLGNQREDAVLMNVSL